MSDTKLKHCPFCGGEVEILTEEVDATREVYNFHCDNCDMSTYYDYSDREEAIKHWNTRKPIDRIVEQLEKEKELHTEHYNISIYKEFPDVIQRYEQIQLVLDKAIEKVKVGGI